MGFYGEIGAGLNFYNLIKDLIPLKTSVFYKLVFFKGIKSLIRLLKFSLARPQLSQKTPYIATYLDNCAIKL